MYWTNHKGEKVDVDTMSKDHLRRVLKLILRNDQRRAEDANKKHQS